MDVSSLSVLWSTRGKRPHSFDELQVLKVFLLALDELKHLILIGDLALGQRVEQGLGNGSRPVVGFLDDLDGGDSRQRTADARQPSLQGSRRSASYARLLGDGAYIAAIWTRVGIASSVIPAR